MLFRFVSRNATPRNKNDLTVAPETGGPTHGASMVALAFKQKAVVRHNDMLP